MNKTRERVKTGAKGGLRSVGLITGEELPLFLKTGLLISITFPVTYFNYFPVLYPTAIFSPNSTDFKRQRMKLLLPPYSNQEFCTRERYLQVLMLV
jgi:hypothetical protein